ncbi:ABC transporter permease [Gulosibacter macacae]|uniref:ABC transporter permease n=1 Tax=Gulosibacter macacae TaxID=2488791 RepID=A0A3P3VYD6_9MICO|nr:ABC transporter permease [Gulosibacter macacae]RRJ87058.1 ABC transporter permease [Gulosibacter macacae]
MSTATPATTVRPTREVSTMSGTMLVAKREIITTLRTPAFIWSFVITLVVVALLILGQRFIGDFFVSAMGDGANTVATAEDPAQLEAAGLEATTTATAAEALDLVRDGTVRAAWVSADDLAGVELFMPNGAPLEVPAGLPGMLVSLDSYPTNIAQALTVQPLAGQLSYQGGVDPLLGYFMGLGFGVLYFSSIMMYASRIAQSVVEEKASRIVEILLSTLRPSAILAGKVIGGTVLAVGQVLAIVLVAMVCFAIAGQGDIASLLGPSFLWFVVLFFPGFVLFAALYGGLAATVSRPEDVPSATSMLMMLAMIPYILVITFSSNPQLMGWMSYIPFSAPVAMPVRIYQGWAQWWEPLVALAILLVTVAAAIWLGARIYENSVLRTQGKVKLTDALKG